MATYVWILLLTGCFCTVTANKSTNSDQSISNQGTTDLKDLNSAASTYYSGWTDPYANSGYGVMGHSGLNNYNAYGAYDNDYRYNRRYNHGPISGQGYIDGYNAHESKPAYVGYSAHKNALEYTLGNNVHHPAYPGNGGYGGYGGNGGLSAYLGYNNPYYHGANHLGYGYYKKPIHGGIYNNGITPSLVTGYRGYSRK